MVYLVCHHHTAFYISKNGKNVALLELLMENKDESWKNGVPNSASWDKSNDNHEIMSSGKNTTILRASLILTGKFVLTRNIRIAIH